MRRGLPVAVLAVLAGPAVAHGAVGATLVGGTLTVTGDDAAQSYVLTQVGANVRLSGITVDPDGGGTACSVDGDAIVCFDPSVSQITIYALGGDDVFRSERTTGQDDPVEVNLGEGADRNTFADDTWAGYEILGEGGDDTLTRPGDNSSSLFRGFSGSSRLDGGPGDDQLLAGTGSITLNDTGGPDNDVVVGGARPDHFRAEPGADTYTGGTAPLPSPLNGDTDPATYQLDRAPDTMLYWAAESGVTVRLGDGANDGRAGEGDDVRDDVERVEGSDFNDVLVAGQHPVAFLAAKGDDQVTGSPGADQLDGGRGTIGGGKLAVRGISGVDADDGSDQVRGLGGDDLLGDGGFTPYKSDAPLPAAGNDLLEGGDGNDVLFSDRGADTLSGGDGRDRVELYRYATQPVASTGESPSIGFQVSLDDQANDGARPSGEGDNVRSDVEDVITDSADDVVTGSAAGNRIVTGSGNDAVTPGGGADDVQTGRGADTVDAVDSTTDRVDCGGDGDSARVDLPGGLPSFADLTIDCEAIAGVALPDVTRPLLKLTGTTRMKVRTFLRRYRLPAVKVDCGEPCSATAEATVSGGRVAAVGDLVVGSARLNQGTGARNLTVRIARKHRTRIRRKLRTRRQRTRGIRFVVKVTVTDAAGYVTTGTRRITVRG